MKSFNFEIDDLLAYDPEEGILEHQQVDSLKKRAKIVGNGISPESLKYYQSQLM